MDDASASTLEGLRAGRDQSRRILGDLIHTSGSTSANGMASMPPQASECMPAAAFRLPRRRRRAEAASPGLSRACARTNISEPERPGVRRFVRKQTDRPDL
jgi:hypothetical protein